MYCISETHHGLLLCIPSQLCFSSLKVTNYGENICLFAHYLGREYLHRWNRQTLQIRVPVPLGVHCQIVTNKALSYINVWHLGCPCAHWSGYCLRRCCGMNWYDPGDPEYWTSFACYTVLHSRPFYLENVRFGCSEKTPVRYGSCSHKCLTLGLEDRCVLNSNYSDPMVLLE